MTPTTSGAEMPPPNPQSLRTDIANLEVSFTQAQQETRPSTAKERLHALRQNVQELRTRMDSVEPQHQAQLAEVRRQLTDLENRVNPALATAMYRELIAQHESSAAVAPSMPQPTQNSVAEFARKENTEFIRKHEQEMLEKQIASESTRLAERLSAEGTSFIDKLWDNKGTIAAYGIPVIGHWMVIVTIKDYLSKTVSVRSLPEYIDMRKQALRQLGFTMDVTMVGQRPTVLISPLPQPHTA